MSYDSIGRQALCPIIGVLPDTHGRLVDADALDKHVYNDIPISVFGSVKKMASVRQIIEDAPTIVPAAKEGEWNERIPMQWQKVSAI